MRLFTFHLSLYASSFDSSSDSSAFKDSGCPGYQTWFRSLLLHLPLTLMILMCCMVNPATGTSIIHRSNYGILFKPVGQIQAVYDYWPHTFQIQLPEEIIPTPFNHTCASTYQVRTRSGTDNGCSLSQRAIIEYDKLRQDSATDLNQVLAEIRTLLVNSHSNLDNSRFKRSLIPFIGKLSKTLFGTASEADIAVLNKHIEALRDSQATQNKAFKRLEDNLSSYMATMAHSMENQDTAIIDNHMAISTLADRLSTFQDTVNASLHLSLLFSKEITLAARFKDQLQALQFSVHDLLQHKLSPTLIPYRFILHTMSQISSTLRFSHPRFRLKHLVPSQIYSSDTFFWTYNNGSIFLTIKFPLTVKEAALTVYEVQALPVPIANNNSQVTQLQDFPPLLAVSTDRLYYAFPSTNSWSHNRRGHLFSSPIPLSPVAHPSCLSALFLQQKAHIKSKCSFRIIQKTPEPSLTYIQDSQYLVSNIHHLTLTCGYQTKTVVGCDFCVMTMPCECDISAGPFYFPPHLTNCLNGTKEVTKVHPVNLAVLIHYYEETHHAILHGDTLLHRRQQISDPYFQTFHNKLSTFINKTNSYKLDLAKTLAAIKEDEAAFNGLNPNLLNALPSGSSTMDILLYMSLAMQVVAALAISFLFYKYGTLAATIAVSHTITTTEAYHLHVPHTTTPTPQTTLPTHSIQIPLTLNSITTTIVLTLVVVYMAFKLYKYCTSPDNLCLEITSGKKCLMVPIMYLPQCPKFYHFTASRLLTAISVTGSQLRPLLSIDWGDLKIINMLNNRGLDPPSVVPISPLRAMQLRAILKAPFYSYIVCTHSRYVFNITVCPNACQGCMERFTPVTPSGDETTPMLVQNETG